MSKSNSKRKFSVDAAATAVVQSASAKTLKLATRAPKDPESNDFSGWLAKCNEFLQKPIGSESLREFLKLSARLVSAACSNGRLDSFLPTDLVAPLVVGYYGSPFPMWDLIDAKTFCGGGGLVSYFEFLAETYTQGEFRIHELNYIHSQVAGSLQGHEVQPLLDAVLTESREDVDVDLNRDFVVTMEPVLFYLQKSHLYTRLVERNDHVTLKAICDSVHTAGSRDAFSHVRAIETTLLDTRDHLWAADSATSRARLFMSWFSLQAHSRMAPELRRGLRQTHAEWIARHADNIHDAAVDNNLADQIVELHESGIPEFADFIDPAELEFIDDLDVVQVNFWSSVASLLQNENLAQEIKAGLAQHKAGPVMQDG